MAGVRDEKPVIEAAHERVGRTKHFMLKDAEKLFGQRVLADAVVMPERGKCAPAHMKRGVDMSETPVEDAFELFPIIHFVKIELFHGCTGNDHAVKPFIFDVIEGLIESIEMVARDVPAAMRGGLKQRELYLQRRIGKQPGNLRFRCDFGRHQVERQNSKWSDVLCARSVWRHDEDVFVKEALIGRKPVGQNDWHRGSAPYERSRSLKETAG